MIIIDKPKLRFLLAGRQVDVQVPREYRKGRVYSVGTRHNKTATCRVQIVHCQPLETGWTVRVQRLSGDVVRLMTRNGYVEAPVELDPDDPDVLVGGRTSEPEMVDDFYIRRYAETNHARDEQLRREAAHRRRMERQGRNLSVSRVKSSVAPPASDIQVDVPRGIG